MKTDYPEIYSQHKHVDPRTTLSARDVEGFDLMSSNILGRQILHFINWIKSLTEPQGYEILLVQAEEGIQVKHWFDRLFFVRPILSTREDGSYVLGASLVVSRFDSNGDPFYPDGPFEIRNKEGKIGKIPYVWQPLVDRPEVERPS